jgi:hypothetical protein
MLGLEPIGSWFKKYIWLSPWSVWAHRTRVRCAIFLTWCWLLRRIVEEDPDGLLYLEREVNVLKGMRHPNIVQFIGIAVVRVFSSLA